jgi:hypothetical protein
LSRFKWIPESQAQILQRIAKDPKLVEAFSLVMQNQFIQTLKANYATLEMDLSELADRYDVKHPSLQRKESQLNTLKGNVNQGIEQIRHSVEMQSQLARTMEEYVRNLIDETKREVFAFNQKAIQYGVLQREVEAQNDIYNLLLKRLNETGVTEQIRAGNASLIGNRSGTENLTLAMPSPYGVPCRHGHTGGPTTRCLGTHPTRSPSLYWGACSTCGSVGGYGAGVTGATPPNLPQFLTPSFERSATVSTSPSPAGATPSWRPTGPSWRYTHPDPCRRSR